MWECCQCLSNKAETSVHCDVCGHKKCKVCFQIKIPAGIKKESEQLFYFELKKMSNGKTILSPIERAHLKSIFESLNITKDRVKEILKVADLNIRLGSKDFYVEKEISAPELRPHTKEEDLEKDLEEDSTKVMYPKLKEIEKKAKTWDTEVIIGTIVLISHP